MAFGLPAGAARADDAIETEALSAPGVAGEILDTALEHCRRGERAQALSMFEAIRSQLEPPPAILRLIQDLEATGCAAPQQARGGSLRIQAGGGWDTNVSQGITSRSLVLGSGDNTLALELDQSYRPRSSAFAQVSADYSLAFPDSGLAFQAAAGHRKNDREPAFDLTTLSGSVGKEFTLAGQRLRGQFEMGEVWLGQRHYQRTQGAALQWVLPRERGAWLATAGFARLDYLTQPTQDARQYEVGLLREFRVNAAATVHGGVSLIKDDASSTRPGGDRTGFQVQAGALLLGYGWRFKPQLTYTSWDSREVFAPGLIDVQRRNRLTYAALQAERPLSSQSSLVLEWRGRWSRDTVALYRYTAHTVTATLAHRF